MSTKKELHKQIQDSKHGFILIKKYFESDLEEIKNLLIDQKSHEILSNLQGQAQKLREVIKLLS